MKRMATGLRIVLLAGASLTGYPGWATACEARSGDATVPLLELYTSEGCDSCPPADRWLAELPSRGFGPDRVVPLAFHVDYWDYLGWHDPFAQGAYTRRQREFGESTHAPTVYTPEFVLNGREYRRWSTNDLNRQLSRFRDIASRADLRLKLERDKTTLEILADATLRDRRAPAVMYLALYENDLHSEVRAGENRGRSLRHAFVVRRLIGPFAFDKAGTAQARETLSLPADWKPPHLGVAAFVQKSTSTEILQALALDVCR